jgi:baseplate J-like protein
MAFDFPIVITSAGLQPQAPSSLQQQLLTTVAATNPGYTPNLPASLIEDISSTDVGAIALCDRAKVELVNSLTPNGANEFLLLQLGQMMGVPMGLPVNTSVNVVFSGTVGYVIPNGFLIGDGTHTFQVQGGGVIGTGGSSSAITAIAIQSGAFGVPANTVTQKITSVPGTVTLTVTNPLAGTPASGSETFESYRARVLQANLVACSSSTRGIKTFVSLVLGTSSNLIAVQQSGTNLRVIVGGSPDVYQIAYAIFLAVGNPGILTGSAVSSGRNVTVSLNDYPDTYSIEYVSAPQQTVTLSVTWNTVLANFTAGAAFPSLVQQPLVNYINSIPIGNPINVMEMNQIFQNAVASLLDPSLLTRLVFTVFINGTSTPPASGTYAVSGDPESYFVAVTSGITVTQG